MSRQVELLIVGAGPAGLEAAITAANVGVEVVLIDGYARPGGQYFKQSPPEFKTEAVPTNRHEAEATTVFERLTAANVELWTDTMVWGASPASHSEGWVLNLHGSGVPSQIEAKVLILATGAYDRPIAFPGWTLPGVMTAGAVQTLLKSQGVLPGRRVLLSGSGPLQLAVAAGLVEAGAEVVGVLEASTIPWWQAARYVPALWGQWERLWEGWGYWHSMRRGRVPYRRGWSVTAAHGREGVEEVTVARLNQNGDPIAGTEETFAVDTLVIGYGFIPAIQLSRLLGCDHEFRPEVGGYVPHRNEFFETTLPGVYAAGDGAGIGGAALAQAEGRIAAFDAARRLGRLSAEGARAGVTAQQPGLVREQRFARMLGALFTPAAGLYSLAQNDTIICRCEEVSLGDIKAAVESGAQTSAEIKGITRAGMGNCQGRICGELAARAVAAQTGVAVEAVGAMTVRPPLYPLTVAELAEAGDTFGG
jgi:thioredoxin reductase/bacterioferritin-associated ferredoxin